MNITEAIAHANILKNQLTLSMFDDSKYNFTEYIEALEVLLKELKINQASKDMNRAMKGG